MSIEYIVRHRRIYTNGLDLDSIRSMGETLSRSRNNDDLVDKLIEVKYIHSKQVESVFRCVDRGQYFLLTHRKLAYIDSAWQHNKLHISAPCIYSDVLQALELKPGLSFLNLGSGTGYLSTMIGLILGTYGINHGIELYKENVVYAEERLKEFLTESQSLDEFSFCVPKFIAGNCLSIPESYPRYDRIYCGAGCIRQYEDNIKKLLKIDGLLVMPFGNKLVKVKRISENLWDTEKLHMVHFTTLIAPSKENNDNPPEQNDFVPPSLQHICREFIRNIFRKSMFSDRPELINQFEPPSDEDIQNSRDYNIISLRLPLNEEINEPPNMEAVAITGRLEMNALLSFAFNRVRQISDDQIRISNNIENSDESDLSDGSFIDEADEESDSLDDRSSEESDEIVEVADLPSSPQNHENSPTEEETNATVSSQPDSSTHDTDEDAREDSVASEPTEPLPNARKRFHSDEEESGGSSDSFQETPAITKRSKVQKRKANANDHSHRRAAISKYMKLKVLELPLPSSLKNYINYNREF